MIQGQMRAQGSISLFEYLKINVFSVFSELEDHCPFFKGLLARNYLEGALFFE